MNIYVDKQMDVLLLERNLVWLSVIRMDDDKRIRYCLLHGVWVHLKRRCGDWLWSSGIGGSFQGSWIF